MMTKCSIHLLLLTSVLSLLQAASALAADISSPVGLWKAFNDAGQPTGYIRISEKDGTYTGIAERGLPTDPEDKRCTECKGQRKNQRLQGMEILWNIHKDGDAYSGGEILDPFSGNIYRAKLELIEGGTQLKVRGYLGVSLFGRTQLWTREE